MRPFLTSYIHHWYWFSSSDDQYTEVLREFLSKTFNDDRQSIRALDFGGLGSGYWEFEK
jgi:hypothetical protein